jgi:hypothetical protein
MDIFKKKVKKYFLLLAGSSICIWIFIRVLLLIFPNLLSFENPDNSVITYSDLFIEFFINYIVNILFIMLIRNDLMSHGLKSKPILIVTFFSSLSGVILYLIVLFKADIETRQNLL